MPLKNLNVKIPDEYQCFSLLMKGRDLRVKIAVLYLIAQLNNKKYLTLAKKYSVSDNLKIKKYAKQAVSVLEKL